MWKIKNDVEMDFMILHKWSHENHMVLTSGKCHYNAISDYDPSKKVTLNNNEIASSNEEKLSGILLDSKLNFDFHITSLGKKAGLNFSALARINHYHSRAEIIAIKLSSKLPIQLLSTDLDVYFSIVK